MAFITGAQYKILADDLAEARDSTSISKDFLFDAVYEVVMLQALYPEIDLLQSFWDTYNTEMNQIASSIPLLGAVKVLQKHVLNRSEYATIDDYLGAEGITVTATFQSLSALAGYTITDSYVVG